MKIYHYTNLEALSQILKNRTIRFNRLDKLDDLQEGKTESLGIKLSKYTFVSCWTESKEEYISLWKLYGGEAGGVRIELPQKMFKEYEIKDLKLPDNLSTVGAMTSLIPSKDFINPDFFILPLFRYDNDVFYRKVQYVDDALQKSKDAFYLEPVGSNTYSVKGDFKKIGTFKNKCWSFQNESRFVIYIMPVNIFIESCKPDFNSIFMKALFSNRQLSFSYYDMCLNEDSLNDLEITLGPSITEGQRIIVQCLVDKYAPGAKIKESSFRDSIRLK